VKNEALLWKRFSQEMYGKETGDWMWQKPENPEQPRDVGYVFGALIIEHYYKNALNLNDVTHEILSLTDYNSFIKKCGYNRKFK
jgi:hypothetical protein